MTPGSAVQVVSTFNCSPMEPALHRAVSAAGIANDVRITPPERLAEYMLAPSEDSEDIIGTIVVVRLEDWLRAYAESQSGQLSDAAARLELRQHLDEFLSHLAVLTMRGRPVWLLTCPSNGWIAEQYKMATLCRTMSNLFAVRVRNLAQVMALNWLADLSNDVTFDREADKADHTPFTSSVYEELASSIARQVASRLSSYDADGVGTATTGSTELAAFLARLLVKVTLAPASASDRIHVDRILRTAASFSLTGEKPTITETEIDGIIQSELCYVVSVSDRLADYGVSGVLAGRTEADALVVETLSLSCTVLGKQVEHALLSGLAQIARARQLQKVVFEFHPSDRNQPALSFLKSATDAGAENQYDLRTDAIEARIRQVAIAPNEWKLEVRPPKIAARGASV